MNFDAGEFIDDSPQIIAGMVLGGLVALFVLKGLGFRFSIAAGG